MTRPGIIRADTIDLQDRDAPTAHGRPNLTTTTPGSLAPHQAETLREVAAETAEENLRSPRVSWANANNSDATDLQRYADDLADGIANSFATLSSDAPNTSTMQAGPQQDALAVAQNGGQETDDADLDAENEADMDDDMMDKMSSSPSIEDGGSPSALLPVGPRPAQLASQSALPCSLEVLSDATSSSPYLEPPEYLPLGRPAFQGEAAPPSQELCCHHHPQGELGGWDVFAVPPSGKACHEEPSDGDKTTLCTEQECEPDKH
ncbi:hypothetical protein QBC39DRAFT_169586 [Podospora conica]|nr:hypothetical protein QBC39DRAFT_169586 [Schizothecium conicum]